MFQHLCDHRWSALAIGRHSLSSSYWTNMFIPWVTNSFMWHQWWRPGAEFGGPEKVFANQDFWMTFFSEKISICTAKISYDLFFSRQPGFSDFPFPRFIFCIFTVLNVVYDPFLTRKTTIAKKKHLFLLCSYFRAHPTTLLLKILWHLHGPSPHLKFWGRPSPQSPPGLRPCVAQGLSAVSGGHWR